jgi:pyruvate,water dikinase
VLHERRAAGVGDTEIIASDPIVLSLVPPSIRPHTLLPEVTLVPAPTDAPRNELADLREELRLRARWLHELTAMVAWEAGTRLHREGKLPAAGAVRWLRLDELRAAVDRGMTVPDLDARRRRVSAPLPAAFRLAVDGRVIAVSGGASDRGQGAGGGRAVGTVFRGNGVPPAGAVLVVRTLDPSLAPVLPHLGGVIAETGSVLSHLAILAREFGVPTVVGVAGAVDRFPAGTEVVIDGTTGDVHIATEAEEPR